MLHALTSRHSQYIMILGSNDVFDAVGQVCSIS